MYDLLLDPSQRKLKTQSSNTKIIAMIGGAVAAVFIRLFFSGCLTGTKIDSSKIVILPFKSLSDTKKEKLLAFGISQDLGLN